MTVEKKALPADLIDALLAGHKKPEDLIGQDGSLKQPTKVLAERALQAEMTGHPGHGKNQLVANATGNTRNGRSQKTPKGDFGALPIEIPRDRAGIRKVIYTINAIESVNMGLRKITKSRGIISGRRGGLQVVLSGAQQYQPEMDHADSELESGAESFYPPIRGTDAAGLSLGETPFTQNPGHPPR